jgi:predicted phosphoribosyltransferase
MFRNREDAAQQLAERLRAYRGRGAVVAALARGAIPMGCQLATELEADLYVVVVRKIGAPGNPELALGAISGGDPPDIWLNQDLVARLGVADSYLQGAIAQQTKELVRRMEAYGADRRNPDLRGKSVILTDDGIATGATIRIALDAIRRRQPARCVLAVPVAPTESVSELRPLVDELICLEQPSPFYAVGAHFEEFTQVSDQQVVLCLADFDARRTVAAGAAPPTRLEPAP